MARKPVPLHDDAPRDPDAGGAGDPARPAAAGLPTRTVLVVTARVEGFRRAGRVFGRAASELDLAALTEAEIAAIEEEPMLVAIREERPAAG